jgi:hypothetical protein
MGLLVFWLLISIFSVFITTAVVLPIMMADIIATILFAYLFGRSGMLFNSHP